MNERVASPVERLADMVTQIWDLATTLDDEDVKTLAAELDTIYSDIEDCYVQVTPTEGQVWEDEMPTRLQALALGRFLRPHFRDPRQASAFVSAGGNGLPRSYVYVRFNDGYEGGIDKEGKTST